jgi:hypothetical protein
MTDAQALQHISFDPTLPPGTTTTPIAAAPVTTKPKWHAGLGKGLRSVGQAFKYPLGRRSAAEQAAWEQHTPAVTAARGELGKAKLTRRMARQQAKLEAMGAIVAEEMFGPW